MKRRILLFSAVAGIFSLTLSSYHNGMWAGSAGSAGSNRTGNAYNGGFNGQNDCSSGSGCHATSSNAFPLNFLITDVSTGLIDTDNSYIPGNTYKLTISGAYIAAPATAQPSFGYQCSVMGWKAPDNWTGSSANEFNTPTASFNIASASPSGADTFSQGGGFIIEQTRKLTNNVGSNPNSYKVSINWKAPDSASFDSIAFFYVMCAVDGDGTANGDSTVIGTPVKLFNASRLAVNNVFKNVSFSTYPNPVSNDLHLAMSNMQNGSYTINAYDMMGRRIVSQGVMVNGSSYTYDMNTASWPAGVYQLQIMKGSAQHTISVVKQ